MSFDQVISSTGLLCSIGKSVFGSTYSFLWSAILLIGFWKCLLVLVAIILWILWELVTRHTHSYNSENGLTPVFNSFIGASTYFWLQTFIYFVLEKLFTEAIYCMKWPYVLHVSVFILTGFALHMSGIWPYWKLFGVKMRIK